MKNDVIYDPTRDKVRRSVNMLFMRLLWNVVNATLFYYSPFFCYGWRRFLLRAFGAKISSTASVHRKAIIDSPWNLTMGENSMISNHAWILCRAKVSLGDRALIGEYVRVLTGSHISNSKSFKSAVADVEIGVDSWVASCAILSSSGYKKLKIGDGAIVGVGAVVLRNVKPMTIVMGNPAKYIADREFNRE